MSGLSIVDKALIVMPLKADAPLVFICVFEMKFGIGSIKTHFHDSSCLTDLKDKACTSDLLAPEARSKRKAVFQVSILREMVSIGSKGGSDSVQRTTERSQGG